MRDVEVVLRGDDPAGVAADLDARRARRRRAVLRWWPVAVLAVAAVVASQVVHDARTRSRVEAAREQTGVIGYDVDPDLSVHASDVTEGAFADVVVGGVRVGRGERPPGVPQQEVRAVTGTDDATGAALWRTEVDGPDVAAGAALFDPVRCTAGDLDAGHVVCFVRDTPVVDLGGGSWQIGAPVRSRLITVDARTGDVVAERDLAPESEVHAAGDDLLLAETLPTGIRVTLDDPGTGGVRWTTELPPAEVVEAEGFFFSTSLQVTDDHVVVDTGVWAWALDRADGTVEVAAPRVWVGRGERLVSGASGGATLLHGRDGSGSTSATGTPVVLDVDDGSVPGLDLLSHQVDGTRRFRAVDPASGAAAWEHENPGTWETSMILLGDVLYGVDARSVWAVDVRDGDEVWRSPVHAGDDGSGPPPRLTWGAPMTDGRLLLLVEPGVTEDGTDAVLHAWDLTSGEHRWTTSLPPETSGDVFVQDGVLYGGRPDPVRLGG